jgi:hypothetical protein
LCTKFSTCEKWLLVIFVLSVGGRVGGGGGCAGWVYFGISVCAYFYIIYFYVLLLYERMNLGVGRVANGANYVVVIKKKEVICVDIWNDNSVRKRNNLDVGVKSKLFW